MGLCTGTDGQGAAVQDYVYQVGQAGMWGMLGTELQLRVNTCTAGTTRPNERQGWCRATCTSCGRGAAGEMYEGASGYVHERG